MWSLDTRVTLHIGGTFCLPMARSCLMTPSALIWPLAPAPPPPLMIAPLRSHYKKFISSVPRSFIWKQWLYCKK